MPDQVNLEMAKLVEVELRSNGSDGETKGSPVKVQFNPESLKLAYSNSVGKTDVTGTAGMQYIASASAKLDLELWFDASVHDTANDVRELSKDVQQFIKPKPVDDVGEAKFIVPAVRFSWGSFVFEGVVTTMNETLELFSYEGRPLRSKITMSISSQDIKFKIQSLDEARGANPGQVPQTPVGEGESVQQLAQQTGGANDWQTLAENNNVDNPRAPGVGSLLAAVPPTRRS